jgi:tripartite-type tricarboxylate transporter receptor subunit TctC
MRWFVWILAATAIAAPHLALAQDYPSRPIRLIMPSPPGGPVESTVRVASQDLTQRLGRPLILENRPGGASIPAVENCMRSAPDGYTLCILSPDAMSFNPHLFERLPYDPDRDLKPVVHLFFVMEALLGSPELPANSVKELQALAVSKPGSINFGTMGPSTTPDVFRQWLSAQWKTELVGIPYKGGPLIATAVLANEVHMTKVGMGNLAGLTGSGKVKVLAIAASTRSPLLPNVPTMAEVGLDGFAFRVWWGMVAPGGTPDAIVNRLNDEFNRLCREPKYTDLLANRYLEPALGSPQAFAAFLKRDREIVGQMVRDYKIPRQ